jgi:hypothetical protein
MTPAEREEALRKMDARLDGMNEDFADLLDDE